MFYSELTFLWNHKITSETLKKPLIGLNKSMYYLHRIFYLYAQLNFLKTQN